MVLKKKSLPLKAGRHLAKNTSNPKGSLNLNLSLSRNFFVKTKFLTKYPSDYFSPDFCGKNKEQTYCKDLNDSELVKMVQKQNGRAYQELFSRYNKKLFTYIFHLVGNKNETEDILQNVFSKTYKNIKNFDTSRKFSSWIYRIAHNETVNFLKRRSKFHSVSWEDITASKDKLDISTNDELPGDRWAKQEINKEIDEALDKLPKKYSQILKLRYFQEFSYEDIGEMLNKPVNTVGTLINRAKKKLLEVVKGQRTDN
jgi:RNA polymerase sigma-70 factor (ECF subfamily)